VSLLKLQVFAQPSDNASFWFETLWNIIIICSNDGLLSLEKYIWITKVPFSWELALYYFLKEIHVEQGHFNKATMGYLFFL